MLHCTDKAQLGHIGKKEVLQKKPACRVGHTWFNYGLDKLKNGGV